MRLWPAVCVDYNTYHENKHYQVGALDQHAAECGGCSPSQLTPRTEAFYNAQRLAQEEESRQERQHQARRPVCAAGT